MAYAAERPKGSGRWSVRFRPLYAGKNERRWVRVRRPCATAAEADQLAKECDRYCRILEHAPTMALVAHALSIGAISAAEATKLRGGPVRPDAVPAQHKVTLRQAAMAHPATRRAADSSAVDGGKHLALLQAFAGWHGSDLLHTVTLDRVLAYVESMRRDGLAWDTRRHRLMALRRACRMAPQFGLPDVLTGLQLDRRAVDEQPEVAVWSGREVAAGWSASAAAGRAAQAVAIGLAGFMGLRSPEVYRLRPADIDLSDMVVRVGRAGAKNRASVRDLPLVRQLAPLLRDLQRQRREMLPCDADRLPILYAISTRRGREPWRGDTYSAWLRAELDQVMPHHLKPTALRASFATWAIQAGIETRHVEAFLGHQASGVLAVTARHYLAAARVQELRPVVRLIEDMIDKWTSTVDVSSQVTARQGL